MTDIQISTILIAIAPTLAAIAVWFKAKSTHDLVNSRMEEMLELVRAKANLAGREEQAAENATSERLDPVLSAELVKFLKQHNKQTGK